MARVRTPSVTRFTDPLFSQPFAAVVRGRGQARQGGHFPSVPKPAPAEKLHDKGPGTHRADPGEPHELGHLRHPGVFCLLRR